MKLLQSQPTLRQESNVMMKRKIVQKIIHVDEDVEKQELLWIAGGDVKWYTFYGKQDGGFSKTEM